MQIACPGCPSRYHFPTEILAVEELPVRCPVCDTRFAVRPDMAPAPGRTVATTAPTMPTPKRRAPTGPQVLATIQPLKRAPDDPS